MNDTHQKTLQPNDFQGTVKAIPAKAEAHRALIAAALADKPTRVVGFDNALSEDITATIHVLQNAGTTIIQDGDALTVTPIDSFPKNVCFDCGESGSTLRFILPVLAALSTNISSADVTGKGRLPQRPLDDLVRVLSQHGIDFSSQTLPLSLSGTMTPGLFELPGNVSSQYISGLLFALPLLNGDSTIKLTTHLESAAYVTMTVQTIKRFSINVTQLEDGWFVPGNQTYRSPDSITVGGDWSNAALWLAAGALKNKITMTGLAKNSAQGDSAILEVLNQFGATVQWSHDSNGEADNPNVQNNNHDTASSRVTVTPNTLAPVTVDMRNIPDLLPVLAVLATAAHGTSRFINAGRLRLKESDRLASVAALITDLGGHVTELPDALEVHGNGSLTGGTVKAQNDHRLVMAATLATAIATSPITIDGIQAINKSYPTLWNDYNTLGGN